MATNTTSDTSENTSYSRDDVIRMDARRTKRFLHELGEMHEEIRSLAASGMAFPRIDSQRGEMSPALTVRAFTNSIEERLTLLWEMLDNHEQAEQEGE